MCSNVFFNAKISSKPQNTNDIVLMLCFTGLYSVEADLTNQKVTVVGIVDREEVLAAIRSKRKDAHFLNEELCKIDKVSDPIQYAKTRRCSTRTTEQNDSSGSKAAASTTAVINSIKRSIIKKISFKRRN